MNIKERVFNNRFFSNASWMIAERVFQMAVSLVVGMLTARYLGPSNYGLINYVAAFVSFATPVCSLGLDGVMVKKYVDYPEKEGEYAGTAIFLELIVAIASAVFIVFVVNISNAGDTIKTTIAALESIVLLAKCTEPIEFLYQARLLSKRTSIIKMVGYTTMSVYRIVLLILGKSVLWFAFATSLDMIVISVLYLLLYKTNNTQKLIFKFCKAKEILSESYHFILANLMVVLYAQMDKIMIQHFLGEKDVGLYSAATTISSLWFFIPNALIASARPLIMEKKKQSESAYLRRLEQLYSAVFWLGIFVGIVCTLSSNIIIKILYGKDYIEASSALTISIWYGTFAQLATARGIWILCEEKNKYVKYYLLWGTIINFVMNYYLIPSCGINGASIATLATQMFVCLIAPLLYRETRESTRIMMRGITMVWKSKKRSNQ